MYPAGDKLRLLRLSTVDAGVVRAANGGVEGAEECVTLGNPLVCFVDEDQDDEDDHNDAGAGAGAPGATRSGAEGGAGSCLFTLGLPSPLPRSPRASDEEEAASDDRELLAATSPVDAATECVMWQGAPCAVLARLSSSASLFAGASPTSPTLQSVINCCSMDLPPPQPPRPPQRPPSFRSSDHPGRPRHTRGRWWGNRSLSPEERAQPHVGAAAPRPMPTAPGQQEGGCASPCAFSLCESLRLPKTSASALCMCDPQRLARFRSPTPPRPHAPTPPGPRPHHLDDAPLVQWPSFSSLSSASSLPQRASSLSVGGEAPRVGAKRDGRGGGKAAASAASAATRLVLDLMSCGVLSNPDAFSLPRPTHSSTATMRR